MCLALISTAHPLYPLILIDNRDEYLNRPTAPAQWWDDPDSHILGGRDLLRPAKGTWLGVTKHGRIAVLTNFRDDTQIQGEKSRGAMITNFLRLPANKDSSTKHFVEQLVDGEDVQQVGGFSLACGQIGEPMAIVSNRVSTKDGITWVAGERDQTVALSNTAYGDRSWPKVVKGEEKLTAALKESYEKSEDENVLIERLLTLLSSDDLPKCSGGGGLETYINQLRDTIYVPVIGGEVTKNKTAEDMRASKDPDKVEVAETNGLTKEKLGLSGPYGTQKQTVILVDGNARIKFFERTLFDDKAQPIPKGQGDRAFEFEVEE